MRETLEALWNGNLAPAQTCGVNDPEMEHLTVLMDRNKELLNGDLNESQKERFAKYADCADEFMLLSSQRAFCDGFRLASRLLTEALSGEL